MLIYCLQINLYAALFWMLYSLLLKNRSVALYCKAFLWFALLAAVLLPLVQLPATTGTPANFTGREVTILAVKTIQQMETGTSHTLFLPYLYATFVALLLLRMVARWLALRAFLKKQEWVAQDGYKLAVATGIGPASFGRHIFFPTTDIDPQILAHEKAHARLAHQRERQLVQVFLCFFFPILPFYLMRRELLLLHEFEADRLAALVPETYFRLLLAQTLGSARLPLLQTFYHQPVKRRIMMLQQPPQKRVPKLLLLATASLLTAGIVLQSRVTAMAQVGKSTAVKATVSTGQKDKDKIFTSVDQMPVFPGGDQALMQFLAANMQYPDTARLAGIEGRVISRFVVGTDGQIEDVHIQRSLSPECDAEVIRVITSMPKWTPARHEGKVVRVYYMLPVVFKLQE